MCLDRLDSRDSATQASRGRSGVWYAAAAAVLVLFGVVAPPLVESWTGVRPSVLRLVYAPLCHQMGERSLVLFGGPLAVCARCTGLYLGAVLGLAAGAWLFVGRPRTIPRPWLAALVLPTAVDGVLAALGVSPLGDVPRFALAIPAGCAAGVLLAIGIHDLVLLVASGRWVARRATDPRAVEES